MGLGESEVTPEIGVKMGERKIAFGVEAAFGCIWLHVHESAGLGGFV
jgi:hypothetical protein